MIPTKIRLDSKSEIKRLKEISLLLNRHGYAPVRFGKDTFGKDAVEFYKKEDIKDNAVPAHFYYKMSGKEFIAFLSVLQKLDEAEKKMLRYVEYVSNSR